MVFFVRKEIDLGRVVLEEVGNDPIANTSGAASHYIYLALLVSMYELWVVILPFR